MDFSLTDEQKLLRETVSRYVASGYDFQAMRGKPVDDPLNVSQWRTFAELGWLALTVPEQDGGLGASLEDVALFFEEIGRGLVCAPLLSTLLSAIIVSKAAESPTRTEALEALMGGEKKIALALEEAGSRHDPAVLTTRAAQNGSAAITLNGRKIVVQDGAGADGFLVSAQMPSKDGKAGVGILLVPANIEGVEIRRYRLIDGRDAADIGFENVKLASESLIVPPAEGLSVLQDTLNRASILLAAEALGAMEAAISITADYLRTRQQFRRPLSDFQVLTHRLSDMFVKAEHARSMVYRGLSAMNGPQEGRDKAVSATMIAIMQAGDFVCGNAVQLHGGVGMADENKIGHFYKRLRTIGKSYGDFNWHMDRYTRQLTA
ncbi:MAG: acyl-CoA dehydrogenase family protein [Rhizobiaceae bacterium]|nr:acyl-CoA dehydrogenase family protein [Rhizobiaceae bacterium]